MLTDFLHTTKVAACQSGTAALHLALVDAGVGPEDVVVYLQSRLLLLLILLNINLHSRFSWIVMIACAWIL